MRSSIWARALPLALPLAWFAAAAPAAAEPAPAPAPAPAVAAASTPVSVSLPFQKFVLPNGLEIILHEDHRTPIVTVNVWYHVGSKDEAEGKNGFAHLFEHLMFQGSRHVGEDMFFKYLERAGTSDRNGTTNTDRTNYFETVPANQLELALWLESDRMAFLLDHTDQATFESQREVVKNERRQNYENAPYGLVGQFVRAALYPADHPYHRLTIGTPEDLDRASLDDARQFFRTYYVPNNATLVIAGDFQPQQAAELVQKYFGPIVRGPTPPVRHHHHHVALDGAKKLQIEAAVELPRLVVTWPTPRAFGPGDPELDVAAQLLASGRSSRLYKRLVYDLQIAQSVSASEQSAQLGSTFEISVTLKKGKSPEEALAQLDAELAKLRAAPPAADELERARTSQVASLVFQNERVGARANALNYYNQLAGDPGFVDKLLARYQAITADDVERAIVSWLPVERRVVAVVNPNPAAPRAGRLVEGK